jgi:glutathione S-transferase
VGQAGRGACPAAPYPRPDNQPGNALKLYNENNPAPNPRKVRIYLAEKGLAVEQVRVPIMKRAHKDPEFLKKNSLGQLPVLELDDGTFISESVAICRYFEELHPSPALFGTGALERALVEMWMRRAEFRLVESHEPGVDPFRSAHGGRRSASSTRSSAR